MSSIIPGYNYDIFISYRQKDNKGDRWVSEFVDALKTELESTFKEEISVYFDINPHDGLLETHDVDASLKDKLKCVVFIPIISRTYCDPKSFAWEHEFKAFVEEAFIDQFGLKVKLPNGNVASRVLPVQIHDLDADDKKLIESEFGGFIRGIEFIYKEPGVNRPLIANEDHPDNNLNKTFYRNQVNKVANAIKEIITGLKNPMNDQNVGSKDIAEENPLPRKIQKTRIIAVTLLLLALVIAGFFILPRLKRPKEQLEKSIAVLPFKLLSNEPDKQYLADGMMDEITLHLSKIKELRVLGRTSTEQYRNPTKTTTAIGQELGVSYLLEGSFQKSGENVRLIVQLIKTGKEGHVWANDYDRNWSDIFKVQSEVAQKVADELNAAITPEEKQLIDKKPTTNLTAYDFYQQAGEELNKYHGNYNKQDLLRAEELYRESLKYDSTFAMAYVGLAWVYQNKHYQEFFSSENSSLDTMLYLANKALAFDSQLSDAYTTRGSYYFFKDQYEKAIVEFDRALKYNPNDYLAYALKGATFENLGDCIQEIDNMNKAVARNKGNDLPNYLDDLASCYSESAGFPDETKYYLQEEYKLTRDSARYLMSFALLKLFTADFEEALKLAKRANRMDSTKIIDLQFYYFLPDSYNDEAYLNAKKWIGICEKTGNLLLKSSLNLNSSRVGIAFWRVGKHKEAEYYFNQQIKYCESTIKNKRFYPKAFGGVYYDLAATYTFLGDKAKAYKYLDEFDKMKTNMDYWVMFMRHDPLFDSIRGEDHFKKIQQGVETRYQAEHERVKKWLQENKML